MGATQGSWTFHTEEGLGIFECDVTISASDGEYSAATAKLPEQFKGSRPWTVMVNTAGATVDGSTLPVDIYAGYASDFLVEWDGSGAGVTVTSGAIIVPDVIADVKASVGTYSYDPRNTAAAAVAPYFAIGVDGSTGLTASAVCHFVVIQGTPYPKG